MMWRWDGRAGSTNSLPEPKLVLNVGYKNRPSTEKYYKCYTMTYGYDINKLSSIHP